MAYTGLHSETKSLAHRLVRRRLLPAFVIGPVLAVSLCNPLVAFAAETGGHESAPAAAQPQVVYTEDVFSTNADFEQSAAETAVASVPQAPVEQGGGGVSPAPEIVSYDSGAGGGAISEIAPSDSNNFVPTAVDTGAPQQSPGVQGTNYSENNLAGETTSAEPARSANALSVPQAESESVEHYESHEASITFSAGDGGSITPIAANGSQSSSSASQEQSTSSDGKITITENYEDSLSGVSGGARAVADDGFHFVKWIDLNNGNTLSTSENFIPERPEEGWPYSWYIQAVFAANVYQVRLDVNGGKTAGGGGGGSGGAITFDVVPGGGFRLPANGTEFTITKVGSAFSGWNTVPDPKKTGASTPLSIEDGALFDSDLESWLQRLGWLKLDWSNGSEPVLTLYAQWVSGQSTITYKASEGGAISAKSCASSVDDSIATETIDAVTGTHFSDSSISGPQGATANASSRHHFVAWDVSGSNQDLADSEANSNVLSAGTATRIARYAEYSGVPEEYHPVTFTAQFAPNSYSFIYEGNGGSGSIASTDVTYGLSAQAASSGMTRSGYKLSGWNLAASGSGTSIALGQTIDNALLDNLFSAGLLSDANGSQVTLYAQWSPEGGSVQPDKPTPGPADNGTSSGGSSSKGNGSGSHAGNGAANAGKGAGSGSSGSTSGKGANKGTGRSAASNTSASDAATIPFFIASPFAGLYIPGISSAVSAGTTEAASTVAASTPHAAAPAAVAASRPAGMLAASGSAASPASPIVIGSSISEALGNGYGDDALTQLMSPEAVQAVETTVAAVAATAAVAGLVGLGVSVAGAAAAAGAAAVGTSGAVALSTAVDLAADLAASAAGAAGAASAGAARRRKEEEAE